MSGDRGSLSIEYVIITPIVFVVLALIFVFGRMADVSGNLDSATRDAVRVATEASSYDKAEAAATKIVRDSTSSASCRSSLTVLLLPADPAQFKPGATITVKASCSYSVADLGVPGAPGHLGVTSQFSAMIDPYRTLG